MPRKDVSDELVCLAHAEYKKTQPAPIAFMRGRAVLQRKEEPLWPYVLLSQWTGEPEKVCYRAMERACENGYLDYGVSLRTAWLTEAGEALIAGKKRRLTHGN